MGATNAPPQGNPVMVQPKQMVQLLNQWQGNPKCNLRVVPLEVWFADEINEAVAIDVVRSGRYKCKVRSNRKNR